MKRGAVQLTPMAATRGTASSARTQSTIGVPSLMDSPSRQVKLNHAQRSGAFAEQTQEGASLRARGQGLAGQQVGAARGQDAEATAVELGEAVLVEVVAAGVLGAVGEIGAVGSDAGGDQRPQPVPTGASRSQNSSRAWHASCTERPEGDGFLVGQALVAKAAYGGLVAGAGHTVGAGVEVVRWISRIRSGVACR